MQTERRLQKIKIGDAVEVRYELRPEGAQQWDSYAVKSVDSPHPDLLDAMSHLIIHVLGICEFAEDYGRNMTVTGLSLSYAHDILGAVVTAQKKLDTAGSPLIINTPHMPADDYSEGGETPVLDADAVNAIRLVEIEALAYVDRKRAQSDLFSEEAAA